jgi:HPt (histidine-containing phosphotransfer) domain-containing protein
MMEKLDSAMARRDLEDAIRAAHTVRGSSATIGAHSLSSAAAVLQAALKAALKAGRDPVPSAELEDFRRELGRVLSSLASLDRIIRR